MKHQTLDKWQTLVVIEALAKFVRLEKEKSMTMFQDKVSTRYTEDLDTLLASLERSKKVTLKY